MNSEKRPTSILTFAFAQALGAFMASVPTAIILCAQHRLSWSNIWVPVVNSLIMGGFVGFLVGAIWISVVEPLLVLVFPGAGPPKPIVVLMTTVMITLSLGIGIWITIMTSQFHEALIWKWAK